MGTTFTIDLTKAIIDVLGQFNRPVSLDEISFRTRSTQTIVENALLKLKAANVVSETWNNGVYYKLNNENQYKLRSLVA